MILKLGTEHQREAFCKVNINHDVGMTLTYFTARSTLVANAFEWGNCQNVILRKKLRFIIQKKICESE